MIRTLLLLLLIVPTALAQTTFHGDAARTGVYPTAGPLQLNGTKWTFKTDGPIIGSPAIANGVVYIGSIDGNVYAVDQETGKQKWKFKTFASRQVTSSPAIANGLVYFGGFDGILYAVDAETGAEKWRFKTGEDTYIHNQQGFQSSPAIVDGTIYVGCRDGHLYAVDAATGRKRWDYPTNKGWVNSTPAIRGGVVYAGTSDGYRFFALDAKTGRLKFTLDAKGAVFSSPAVAGDLAYVGVSNGRLLAVDVKSGKLMWNFQTEGSKQDPLKMLKPDGGLNNEAIYARYFGDYQDMVLAFYRVFSVGAIWSSPVVDKGVVYFGSTDGSLYAIH